MTIVFLIALFLILSPVALTLYGLYLAFKENNLLGLLCIFVHPLPLILGVAALFGNKTLPRKIAKWLRM